MIQRYKLIRHDHGDVVLYADHLTEIAAKDAEIAKLKGTIADTMTILWNAIDRERDDMDLRALASGVSNAIHWRDKEIAKLRQLADDLVIVTRSFLDHAEDEHTHCSRSLMREARELLARIDAMKGG